MIGDVFLRYESYWGSGEEGCYQAYRITGEPYAEPPHLTPVQWIAHSCGRVRPSRCVSIRIDHYENAGEVLWLIKEGEPV